MRTVEIVVLDDHQQAAEHYLPLEALSAVCSPSLTAYTDVATSPEQLVERLAPAEVVLVMRERSRLSRSVLERLGSTRLLITSGARNAAIDREAARERGIAVSGTRGKDGAPAELAWGLLLALMRRIPSEDAGVRAGRWGAHVGDTLEHKRLGIFGLGDLGTRILRYGQAFGMEALACSPNLDRTRAELLGCAVVDRETLCREADVISINAQLTPTTRGAIGSREFGLMKRSAVLVNTSRGAIVDEAALVDALRDRRIGGAALDVFEQEPLAPDSPLLELDNVILTPHIGYVTDARYRDYFGQAAEIIESYVKGAPIRQLA